MCARLCGRGEEGEEGGREEEEEKGGRPYVRLGL